MPERHLHPVSAAELELAEHRRHLAELCDERDHAPRGETGPLSKRIAEQRCLIVAAELDRYGLTGPRGTSGCTPPSWRDVNGGLDAHGNPFDEDAARGSGIR